MESRETIQRLQETLNKTILGKPDQTELALACVFSRGHFIVEDRPGVGKTTFVKALGQLCGFQSSRIQFTNDMLPADILGTQIFDPSSGNFSFKKGPIFSQYVIADEINRGSPKTQSAFLQAMEERAVTIDGQQYSLPEAFLVVATQNPIDLVGTFPLPDSQLDRFSAVIKMGFPTESDEKKLMRNPVEVHSLDPVCQPTAIEEIQKAAREVQISEALEDYVYRLVQASRMRKDCEGLSTRAAQSLLSTARSLALLRQRDYLIPEDIQSCFASCTAHRLFAKQQTGPQIAEEILRATAV